MSQQDSSSSHSHSSGGSGGGVYQNTNGMPLADGRTLHMDLRLGEAANRVITVGALSRAQVVARHLDGGAAGAFSHGSSRGFHTITGTYKGVPVSIVSIGMGAAMMDFFVRELRAVVEGPMAIVRLGTCGGLSSDAPAGSVVVASAGSAFVSRKWDDFPCDGAASSTLGYNIHKVVPADPTLSGHLAEQVRREAGAECTVEGANVTADSFYSSQGRIDSAFDDGNGDLIAAVTASVPLAKSMEMESYVLLHLARCSKTPILASAAAIVVANRNSGVVVEEARLSQLEDRCGVACLEALIATPL